MEVSRGAGRELTVALVMRQPCFAELRAAGGKLVIERGSGGEIGVCLLEDNRQCEEWALLRGLCPAGGIRVTGYATPEERLCAIRGGEYTNTGECRIPTPR